jgi:hypothetical protein
MWDALATMIISQPGSRPAACLTIASETRIIAPLV